VIYCYLLLSAISWIQKTEGDLDCHTHNFNNKKTGGIIIGKLIGLHNPMDKGECFNFMKA
jgi:hypothetical protein